MSAADSFTVSRYYPVSVECIWDTVNSRELILADWALELDGVIAQPGTSLKIKVLGIPGTQFCGKLVCKYLEVIHYRRITFQLVPFAAPLWTLNGQWEFTKQERGTSVHFALSGFGPRRDHRLVRHVIKGAMEHVMRRIGQSLDAAQCPPPVETHQIVCHRKPSLVNVDHIRLPSKHELCHHGRQLC
ncbi:Uncharacterised protein [Mycobacteroides abscessus subsp. abscessus]|nr:Uncharacterised protein [Mycobacteroides abscessus subsp. abscessus]